MYKVLGNRSAADVVADHDEEIGRDIADLDEARRVAIAAQSFEGFVAAWVEEQPCIVVTIESDARGNKHKVVRVNGWQV
jgi:hypothetical protein